MTDVTRRVYVSVANLAFQVPLLRKWGCIIRAVRSMGLGWAESRQLWNQSVDEWNPGLAKVGPLGFTRDQASLFFDLALAREDERAEYYRCVEGCCTVIWSNGRNSGGYGPAGCPCDRLKDPRGEKIDA